MSAARVLAPRLSAAGLGGRGQGAELVFDGRHIRHLSGRVIGKSGDNGAQVLRR